MKKNPQVTLDELVFGTSDKTISKQISREQEKGTLRKIAPKIYTTNLEDDPEVIIRRNLFSVLAHRYPGAVLSHRSALEFKPTTTGDIFITYKYTKKVQLPGVTVNLLEGHGPVKGDKPVSGELYASQQARAFLENFEISRKPGPHSKTLSYPLLEERLEQVIRVHGEGALNELRDEARRIGEELGMEKEFSKLNQLISALLSTHSPNVLTSSLAQARASGLPYDPARIDLFQLLFDALNQKEFENRMDQNNSLQSFRNFAFFESYFSNYIEGTVFGLDEAKEIVTTQKPITNRHEDSHDILGTYQLVSNRKEMNIIPGDADQLLSMLKHRHKILLSARKDKNPGRFKEQNNYAGNTMFVDFNLVRGTFMKAFELYRLLTHPFAKAAYMMFMVSEIHPFLDGNGRVARIMMNAELVKEGHAKIIIPNVYRDDYLGALRRITRQQDTDVFIRMLSRAHHFSSTITGSTMDEMQERLEQSNAFHEHTEGYLLKIVES